MIPNFLTPDHFEGVRQECMELLKKPDQVTKVVQGSTTKEMAPLMDHEVGELPHIDRFFADKRFHKVLEAVEKAADGSAHVLSRRRTCGAGDRPGERI